MHNAVEKLMKRKLRIKSAIYFIIYCIIFFSYIIYRFYLIQCYYLDFDNNEKQLGEIVSFCTKLCANN